MAKTNVKRKPTNQNKNSDLPSAEVLEKLYHDMLLIRRFEEKAGQLYQQGLIAGFCHLYIGQEACVVGMESVKDPADTNITTYRDHGHMLATGMDPRGVMAELTGRIGGYSKGKGGSMHMFSREKKFYGGHGIVGATSALGTGLAFAHQYNQDGGVCHCYMGDGSANQGQFFEAMNMAQLWKLPVLYLIENNGYGMGTSCARHAAGSLKDRGAAFGIPGEEVDGMDVLAVREAGKKALEYVRSGKGPMILELKTYRYRGHSMSDPAKYRTRDEVDEYRALDPIEKVKSLMIDNGMRTAEELKALEKDVKAIIKETEEFATTSPEPDASELWTDVLIEE